MSADEPIPYLPVELDDLAPYALTPAAWELLGAVVPPVS